MTDPEKRWKQLRRSFNGHYKNSNYNWYLYKDLKFLEQHTKVKKTSGAGIVGNASHLPSPGV